MAKHNGERQWLQNDKVKLFRDFKIQTVTYLAYNITYIRLIENMLLWLISVAML